MSDTPRARFDSRTDAIEFSYRAGAETHNELVELRQLPRGFKDLIARCQLGAPQWIELTPGERVLLGVRED